MGGAFVGIADDATAAYSNPAGLLWRTRSEISLEARSWEHITRYPVNGSFNGLPREDLSPADNPLDRIDVHKGRLQFKDFLTGRDGLGFLSYLFVPSRDGISGESDRVGNLAKSSWRFAAYRHELSNFSAKISNGGGSFLRTRTRDNPRTRLAGVRGELLLRVTGYGASVAYEASEHLWVGGSLVVYDFRLDGITRRYRSIVSNRNPTARYRDCYEMIGFQDGCLSFSDDNEFDRHLQSGSSQELGFNVGVLTHGSNRRWSVGIVYRSSSSFPFSYSFEYGARAFYEADVLQDDSIISREVAEMLSGRAEFRLPDVLSMGVAIRPMENLTIGLDLNHVWYSKLRPSGNILVNGERFLPDFVLDDGEEVRLGVEYTIPRWFKETLLVVRSGIWHDPDHQMYFRFDVDKELLGAPQDRLAARFPKGTDIFHYTFGFGGILRHGAVEVSAAWDTSERGNVVSVSGTWKF